MRKDIVGEGRCFPLRTLLGKAAGADAMFALLSRTSPVSPLTLREYVATAVFLCAGSPGNPAAAPHFAGICISRTAWARRERPSSITSGRLKV
jgi:hypothetical protein